MSNRVYAIFFILAYAIIIYETTNQLIPSAGYITLFPVIFSLFALYGAMRYKAHIVK